MRFFDYLGHATQAPGTTGRVTTGMKASIGGARSPYARSIVMHVNHER
ncbi:hypothetical protein [Sphingomonas sp. Leaf37]|nr:hypothetical protein [Sphingomonas sp. Leaf37]